MTQHHPHTPTYRVEHTFGAQWGTYGLASNLVLSAALAWALAAAQCGETVRVVDEETGDIWGDE